MQENSAHVTQESNGQWKYLAFQSVAVVSLGVVFGERAWRLFRNLNRQGNFRGRG